MLHLDDWEHCDELFHDPSAKENFIWGSPKSKNTIIKLNTLSSQLIKMEDLKFHI